MTEDERRALDLQKSLEKSKLTKQEEQESSRDIELIASRSKLNVVGPKEEIEPEPEPESGIDYAAMVGKTFVRRKPGIYIGAAYTVKALNGNQMLISRQDSATGAFEFTMSAAMFQRMMEFAKEKPALVTPPKELEKPVSPWADKKKK